MFADISCFSALYEANLFLNPADFTGETALLSVPRRKNQCVLGDQVTPAACSLCENQRWLPSTREQNIKTLLTSFSLFDPYFLKVRRSITFNKTYWMMQVVFWNAVVLWAPSTAKKCSHLFHLLFFLCAPLCPCFGFCLPGKFPRFKTAGEEMSPSKHACT